MPPHLIDLRQADDTRDVVHRAVQTLAEGGLVVFPTETVYGVGASARSVAGVQRIFAAKGRSQQAPLVLAIKSAEEAFDYVIHPGRIAERLARRCWPGPITLVMDRYNYGAGNYGAGNYGAGNSSAGNSGEGGAGRVADRQGGNEQAGDGHASDRLGSAGQGSASWGAGGSLIDQLPVEVRRVVSPNGTIGMRVPAHDTLLATLQMLAGPIALTSANRSGEPAAVTAQQAAASLGDHVALVLDDGPCRYGQPSTVVRATAEGFRCLREGVVSQSALDRLSSMIILFVCTGNTCRSPMAEVLMRKLVAEKLGCSVDELDQRGVLLASAGIAAAPGSAPSAEAVVVMEDKSLCLANHASQPLTEKLVRHADVILTMTGAHRQAIIRRWPDAATRTHTVLPNGKDISDPIGGPISVYRECAEQIERALRARVEELDFA